ncbi:MAG: murein biosynthesis integral membrane protein MurJ [Chloroflexi bacterium RBG_19FT_COMBO_50_10]|nr:MAG: murein biosynthesis integral membrane protein MurJ [Chloroflexi bacterium RBG_19FT_COMBO_50_10]
MTVIEDSANQQIARSAGKVMIALLLGNLANLVSLILNATTFGTQADMDAFLAANRVSETLFLLMAGGALGSAFIPTFTGLLTKGERNPAWKLASAIANLVLVVLILAAVLAAIFAQPLVHYVLAPGFASNPAQEALTVNLLRIMLPSAVIFGLSGLVMGILNSHQVFFIPALTPAMYRLGMIFGVLFLTPTMGIYGLAWGVVIGACLHLVLQLPSLLRLKGSYIPTLGLKIPDVRQVGLLMAPRVFGVAVVQLNFWVNTRLASQMSEGSVTGITWGLTMMLMPQAIIAQSVAMAALPTLSAQFALDKIGDLRTSLATSLRGILLLSIPASLGMILLRQPIVALMLQYGKFTEESTQLISWALLWYSAGLVGHSMVEILARAFYAMHDTKTPVWVGSVAMGLNVIFSLLFSAWFARIGWMPHGGLALANSLATGLEAVSLFILMRRKLGGLEGDKIIKGTGQAVLGTIAMAVVLWGWLELIKGGPAWLVGGAGVMLGGFVYGLSVLVLKVPEVKSVLNLIKRRLTVAYK